MTNEELNTALYQKMYAEQEDYRAWLKAQPLDEILNHTYEYTVREDILITLEHNDLSDEQAAALLRIDSPLADVFREFEKRETDYMDVVLDSLASCADTEITREHERRDALCSLPVYPYPADYARANGELEQYRASRKANIACKEAIEQAIGDHYADNRLDTSAAVRQVADAFGYERMLYVLAVTVRHKDWDGRISDSNKAWAASVPVIEDKADGRTDNNVYLVVSKAHPGLTDLFVRGTRKAQAQELEKAGKANAPAAEKASVLEKLKQPVQKNAPKHSAHFLE